MPKSEQEIKNLVAKNIAALRKKSGLTQGELAEKLNYSDKSVSKWERAEGLPDLLVLNNMAEILGVSASDFLSEDADKIKTVRQEVAPLSKRSKIIITAMAVGLVLLFASVVFFVLGLVGIDPFYLGLVYYCAIPVSAIVLTVFTMLWFSKLASGLSVALLIWSVTFGTFWYIPLIGMKYVFAIAAALQVLEVLWYLFLWLRSRENKKSCD